MNDPKNNFILAGDWHGKVHQAFEVINYARSNNIDTIVQVGDFGITPDNSFFIDSIQKYLEEFKIVIYFVDGNKDHQPTLYKLPFEEDGTQKVSDNIFYLPRGFRWTWSNFTFLALGGAPSINRNLNPIHAWCIEECITEEDINVATTGGPVDFLITHDSPAGIPNYIDDENSLGVLEKFGADAIQYCRDHRELLRRVSDVVTPRFITHGHFHARMKSFSKHNNGTGPSVYTLGLNQGGSILRSHIWAVDFSKLTIFKSQLEEMDNPIAV